MRIGRRQITAAVLLGVVLVSGSGVTAWLILAHVMRFGPFSDRAALRDTSVADLPLLVTPAGKTSENAGLMAILYTGDGGWTLIDQRLTAELARHGVPTVSVISPRYFWTRRTPDAAARDLGRLIDYYTAAWSRPRVILIGYSRGAGVLPAMVNRLDGEQLKKLDKLALLGLEPRIAFAVGLRDYARIFDTDEQDVLPEVQQLKVPVVICIYGKGEKDALALQLDLPFIKKILLPGGHHFGGAYERIAQLILAGNAAQPESLSLIPPARAKHSHRH